MMTRMGFWSVLGYVALAALGLPAIGRAFDFGVTIPASACSPVNEVGAELVFLQSGAWAFTSAASATGTVTFNCPVPRNVWPLTFDGGQVSISGFRVYYRDTDAAGSAAQLRAALRGRRSNGSQLNTGPLWQSAPADTGFRAEFVSNPHVVQGDTLYYFEVQMTRSSSSQRPIFIGIDFVPVVGP